MNQCFHSRSPSRTFSDSGGTGAWKRLVVDEVLEDIYEHLKSLMTPPRNDPNTKKWR